jgi:hypothetical protein
MKKFLLLLAVGLIGWAQEETPSNDGAPAPEEKSAEAIRGAADSTAGTWKMIVLTGPTQVPVAAPLPVTDANYLAEIAAVKTAQSRISNDERKAVEYWGKGGVVRWNEILMELVARANLPPAPRDDDTYVFPDANNPFADPRFPFATPPYAARAYAYVSVAQFEALKAAWHYKYLYNRPAPTKVDNSVQALRPAIDVPAYPSEEAVIAAATTEILRLLFPADVEQITLKAAEHRNAALLSGRVTASDIAAGTALGTAVANIVINRARTDGMGAAIGNAASWQKLADDTKARGEIPWISLETPARPPMLPNFGNVLPWMMTRAEVVADRPAPPPSTSSSQFARELAEVKQISSRLTRQQMAIAYKWSDGAGTPTPPGHWNLIAGQLIGLTPNSTEVRTARSYALLNMAMHDAAVCTWDTKYFYFNPRPSQMDRSIRTVIGLPNFPAYVSGHSTFSSAATEVLAYLFPAQRSSLSVMRDEASISRLYGAIHYRSDIEVGSSMGKKVAGYTLKFAQEDGADK